MLHYARKSRNKYKSEATHSSSHRAEANTGLPTAGDTWVLVTPPHAMLRTKATGRTLTPWTNQVGDSHFTSAFAERWLSKELPQEEAAKGPLPKEAYAWSFPMASGSWGPPGRGGRTTGPRGGGLRRDSRLPASRESLPSTCGEIPVKGREAHRYHD